MERYRPRNSFPERLGRSEPRTSIQRASPTPWHRGKARVALRAGIRCQCFQTLEEGVHNDSIVALGRKSWLFAGSDRGGERAAVMYTLIGTAKLNDVDPQAWLADVLDRIADLPQTRLHELLPWSWKADRQQALAA